MSPSKSNQQNLAKPPANNTYQDEQKAIRERNDEARRAGKKERLDGERRADAARRARDRRDGVDR
jgi:hypothetical protein